jgi:hypothetical protein
MLNLFFFVCLYLFWFYFFQLIVKKHPDRWRIIIIVLTRSHCRDKGNEKADGNEDADGD